MNKTILTDEESRRLIELGVNAGEGTFFPHPEGEYWQGDECGDIYFTLEDLLRILPKKIIAKKATYLLAFGVCAHFDNWYVKYKHERTNTTLYDLWSIRGELIDAIYEILLKIKGKRYKIKEV